MSTLVVGHEQSSLILNGFLREQSNLLSNEDDLLQFIPKPIKDLISLFSGDLFDNHGSFTWKITDSSMVGKILNAKNGEKFESDPFMISRTKCQLEIYPNGHTQEISGYFVIFLKIVSIPKYVQCINIGRIFRVLENKAAAGYQKKYVNTQEPDYWTRKCPLAELQAINPNTINVQVDIFINKIILNTIIDNILDYYPLSPSPIKELAVNHHLEYTFDENIMDLIKDDKSGLIKSFCTNLLDDMWYISIYPIGAYPDSLEALSIYFGLLKWPRNVNSMKIRCKITGANDEILPWENDRQFGGDKGFSWGAEQFCLLNELKQMDKLTVNVDLKIENIEYYNDYNKDPFMIDDPVQIAYLLS